MRACLSVLTLCSTLLLGGCGYGTLQEQRAEVTASWEELVALYQARGSRSSGSRIFRGASSVFVFLANMVTSKKKGPERSLAAQKKDRKPG